MSVQRPRSNSELIILNSKVDANGLICVQQEIECVAIGISDLMTLSLSPENVRV